MRLGTSIPQAGVLGTPEAIVAVATAAETSGLDSLWAYDRILAPVAPRSPYPGTADGSLPPEHRRMLDPLATLSFASAVTSQIRLGTNVLVAPWYPTVLLARSLATIDQLSHGRLTVGLGLGWSVDEYEAAGVPMKRLGARMDAILDALGAIWEDDVVSFDGDDIRIPASTIEPKPVQSPPPVLLAGFTPAGLDRVARRADGWLPVGIPHGMMATMWAGIRDAAAGYGRDPDQLQLVVRANVHVSASPLDGDRPVFSGSIDQIAEDVDSAERAGAHELVLDVQADARSAGDVTELVSAIRTAAGRTPALAGR